MTIVILYGTETGNAEMLADDLSYKLMDNHETRVVNMADADIAVFQEDALFLIVTATYGDGEMPTSARPFHEALSSARPDLSGKRFAVFGLGDRKYPDTFNFGGKQVEELLLVLGAQCVAPRGMHDASGDDLAEDLAARWLEDVLQSLATA